MNTSYVPVSMNMKCWDPMWKYQSHRSRITLYCVVASPHHCKFRSVSTLKYQLHASSAASHKCTRKRYVLRLTLSVPLRSVKLFSCIPSVANSPWLPAKEPHTADWEIRGNLPFENSHDERRHRLVGPDRPSEHPYSVPGPRSADQITSLPRQNEG
jgi:hypothetical protein